MDVSILLVADYANVTQDGKLNVMGIFHNINALNFPATHPEMHLITQLKAGPAEYEREFTLDIKLIDDDASHILLQQTFRLVVPRGTAGQTVYMNHLLRMINVQFPKPGSYEFSVLVDRDVKGSLPIEVHKLSLSDS
jgi:hypothetical protein